MKLVAPVTIFLLTICFLIWTHEVDHIDKVLSDGEALPQITHISDHERSFQLYSWSLGFDSYILGPIDNGMHIVSVTAVSCYGQDDGSAVAIVNGGVWPYSYEWSTGDTMSYIENLVPGDYSLTISDSDGNMSSEDFTVDEPLEILLTFQITAPSSMGGNDGAIDMTATGGSSGGLFPWDFEYEWSNDSISEDINNLTAGFYTVTVTDFTGCFKVATVEVPDIPCNEINSNEVSSDISCSGASDGSITISPNGGSTPYTIQWSTGASGSIVSGLAAGTYQVTITDDLGCISVDTFEIVQPTLLQATFTSQDESTPGASDGSIDLSVQGGASPYSFAWSDGSNSEYLSALAGGSYTVTITDDNGCILIADETIATGCHPAGTPCDDGDPATINDQEDGNCVCTGNPCPDIQSGLATTDVSCFGGSDGTATVNPSNGSSPYSINWSTGASGSIVSGLAAGTYQVTITDNLGCVSVDTFEVDQPALLQATFTTQDESSPGASDGSIDLSVQGGINPYSFAWSSGSFSEDLSGLTGGTYTVTITDDNGCILIADETIATGCHSAGTPCDDGDPATINDQEDGNCLCTGTPCPDLQSGLAITDVSCFGGSDGTATANPANGSSPYTFNWSTGATSSTVTGLAAGNFQVTITDNLGCVSIDTFEIVQPALLQATFTTQDESTPGASDGSIDLSLQGGSSPYSISWSDGTTSEDLSRLAGGSYTVTITDDNGCILIADETIATGCHPAGTLCDDGDPATINDQEDGNCLCIGTPCPDIQSGLTATEVSCFGGSDGTATANPANGSSPYSIQWSTGASGSIVSGLAAGTYQVTVTDNLGCVSVETFEVDQPALLQATFTSQEESSPGASDGSIDLSLQGGSSPYSITWSDGTTSEDLSGLAGGSYTVTITDDNGCILIADETIATGCHSAGTLCDDGDPATINDQEDGNCLCTGTPCPDIQSGLATTDVSCFGGSDGTATVNPANGSSPYSIQWSTGATGITVSGLAAGTYQVTITDNLGCVSVETFEVDQPTFLQATFTSQEESSPGASDGSIDLSLHGATSPYSFAWSDGSTSEDLSGLTGGTYTVTITDDNGCILIADETIATGCHPAGTPCDDGDPATINDQEDGNCLCTGTPCPDIQSGLATTDVSCFGGQDGSAAVLPTNGIAPYSISWSTGAAGTSVSGLEAGTYQVTITDNLGCVSVDTFEVDQPAFLQATFTTQDESSHGASDGSIDLSVQGGASPYSFAWSNGSFSEDLSGLAGGTYTVTITDGNGCVLFADETIATGCHSAGTLCDDGDPATINDQEDGNCLCAGVPCPDIQSGLTATDVSCFGGQDGSAAVLPTNGNSPYTIQWSTGVSGTSVSGLAAGTYQVTITDDTGCETIDTFEIVEPSLLQATFISQDESSPGASDGSIDLTVQGGTSPYAFAWSVGTNEEDLSGLTSGNYEVTITDDNGCSYLLAATVAEQSCLSDSILEQINLSFYPPTECEQNGTINIETNLPGDRYYYSLSETGPFTPLTKFDNLIPGVHSVYVNDLTLNCVQNVGTAYWVDTVEMPELIFSAPSLCGSDGSATLKSLPEGLEISISTEGPWTTTGIHNLNNGPHSIYGRRYNGCPFLIREINSLANTNQPVVIIKTYPASECSNQQGLIEIEIPDTNFRYSLSEGFEWYKGLQRIAVSPGTYDLWVADQDNCISKGYHSIEIPLRTGINDLSYHIEATECHEADGRATFYSNLEDFALSVDKGLNWTSEPTITNLSAGTHTVWISDESQQCIDSIEIDIPGRLVDLSVEQVVLPPLCHGNKDGFIRYRVDGPPNYEYHWSTGSSNAEIGSLTAGEYSLTVTESGTGCRTQMDFSLPDPPPVLFDVDVSDSTILCKGESITIGTNNPNLKYQWFQDQLQFTSGNEVQVTTEGNYLVEGRDSNGCLATQHFDIGYDTDVFHANFLVASTVLLGSEVKIIEISWPLPDQITWVIPGGQIIEQQVDQATVRFDSPGQHLITLWADKGNCMSAITKEISVVDDPGLLDSLPANSMSAIKNVEVYPNPNNGEFYLKVDLIAESSIQIRIYDISGNPVHASNHPKSRSHRVDISLPTTVPGVYTTLIASEGDWKSVNVIVE